MTRGNQREINRKRAEARAAATNGPVKRTSKEDDLAALRAKQAAADARKKAEEEARLAALRSQNEQKQK